MTNTPAATWIRIGLFTLPDFGLLTLWSTIGAQPNAAVDPAGWPVTSAIRPTCTATCWAAPEGRFWQSSALSHSGPTWLPAVCVLGVAVWRSGTLPRWAGALWIAAWVVFVVLGAALGMATTGASLPTQPVGAGLMAISGAWMAWAATRQPAVITEPQPSRV